MGLHLPPRIAAFLTVAFIVFLFRRDYRERPNVTRALWVPIVWMLIIGSRSVVQWLNLLGFPVGTSSMEEGNPLDAFVFFALIVAGFYILNQRQVSLSEVFRNNGWLMAFLVYCLIAIIWSDFPFVALKRYIKILGHPVMVLILFTEPDPDEAITRLIKRCAYVLLPLSILFIKYYPDLGRGFDAWTGAAMNNGVNVNKNELGVMCMIFGSFFFWHFLRTWGIRRSQARRRELLFTAGFLYITWWLLWKSDSQTSFLSLLIGMLIIAVLGLRIMNKKLIGMYAIAVVIALVVAESAFGIFDHVIGMTGHGSTIAGRNELWRELLALHTNPIFGVGFESFWLGDRLKALWKIHWWQPTEAHNGYLETYLNLGSVGLFMLGGVIVATFAKIRFALLSDLQFARFRLGFLAAVIFYNWTEATFKGLSPVWFVFYIIAMDYPRYESESAEVFGFEISAHDREFAYTDSSPKVPSGFEGLEG